MRVYSPCSATCTNLACSVLEHVAISSDYTEHYKREITAASNAGHESSHGVC